MNPLPVLSLSYLLLLSALWTEPCAANPDQQDTDGGKQAINTLSDQEKKAGWKLLFNGKSIEGWRHYRSTAGNITGWRVEHGTLHKPAGVRAGDIMTSGTYENFEFSWEWKLPKRGNNGVKYFITKERGAAIGHEYQMIDDAIVKDPYSSNASFYLLVKPAKDKPNKPMGEWNQSRILVRGNHCEHWLNGSKVLDYECSSPAIMNRVTKTKFRKYPGFGKKVTGHILLTDHKDPCWYRNLKIRALSKH
ncbi:MAG: DUF1080 domain-containing protein [Verrucomicrobiaceae bacterium]|nr:DUF1080 domain-containing protein [Verrucomicrobiaceae bacterium]